LTETPLPRRGPWSFLGVRGSSRRAPGASVEKGSTTNVGVLRARHILSLSGPVFRNSQNGPNTPLLPSKSTDNVRTSLYSDPITPFLVCIKDRVRRAGKHPGFVFKAAEGYAGVFCVHSISVLEGFTPFFGRARHSVRCPGLVFPRVVAGKWMWCGFMNNGSLRFFILFILFSGDRGSYDPKPVLGVVIFRVIEALYFHLENLVHPYF